MDMKAVMSKHHKLITWVLCMASIIVGGVYYFGILNAFVPNTEDIGSVQHWYLILKYGRTYEHLNIIYDLVFCLSVLAGGMSYFSLRLGFMLLYTVVLGLSLFLCVCRGKKDRQWSVLPVWFFFMVLVHTVHAGSDFARAEGTDLIYQLPYNYHITSVIFALICMIMLQYFVNAEKGKKKTMIGCAGIVVGLYACLFTDLVYYVVFVAPLLIVLVFRGFYHDRTKKYMLPFLAVCAGVLVLTRIMPGSFFESLWKAEAVRNAYGGAVYGETDWLDMGNILTHCVNYVKVVMALFNVEISDRPLLSLYSVLFLVRIALIAVGYLIVGKILICSIKGKAAQCGYTIIDEMSAWAFTLLSCVFIFTRNGENETLVRYFPALVPLLTIVLCRNLIGFIKAFLPVLEEFRHKKIYFAAVTAALCICQAEPVWQYRATDSYQEECEAVIEWLRSWGVEADGYALAPYWLNSRLSAMTGGDILFYNNKESIWEVYGEDAPIRYVVIGWDDVLPQSYEIVDGTSSYDEWIERQEMPILRAVDLDHVYVCEFAE